MQLSRYSKSAAKAVIDAGGSLSAVYRNQLGLRQELHPDKFEGRVVQQARPTRRADIREYPESLLR